MVVLARISELYREMLTLREIPPLGFQTENKLSVQTQRGTGHKASNRIAHSHEPVARFLPN